MIFAKNNFFFEKINFKFSEFQKCITRPSFELELKEGQFDAYDIPFEQDTLVENASSVFSDQKFLKYFVLLFVQFEQ